ncbi:MAG TPA: hypothetical protein VL357_12025 [Rariglobus sp.]|jgi:hypothetical protein|nr:hypothetical protein [Rariglobus sp.]
MAAPVTFETFQQELTSLVARFDREHAHFTNPDYNEAMVREDFLNPFFRALGWDVGNSKGLIHTEREVDIEVRTALSGKQTRADYVFRVARVERFTCEAKKPAEKLHSDHRKSNECVFGFYAPKHKLSPLWRHVWCNYPQLFPHAKLV